jgi:hypothetical protein
MYLEPALEGAYYETQSMLRCERAALSRQAVYI